MDAFRQVSPGGTLANAPGALGYVGTCAAGSLDGAAALVD